MEQKVHEKQCSKCKEVKPTTDFNKGKHPDGLRTECRSCQSKQTIIDSANRRIRGRASIRHGTGMHNFELFAISHNQPAKQNLTAMKITTEVILLTPETATDLLSRNATNRPMSETTVRRYEGAINRGEWMVNGEPLIIFSDESLGNGQHRCKAVINTGISIQTLVVKGIHPNAFLTLDQGKPRGAADVLAINGQKHGTKSAAAARAYLGETVGGRTGAIFSNTQILNCIEDHPHITYWVAKLVSMKGKHFPAMMAGYFAFASEKFGIEKLDGLMDKLSTGEDLKKTNPAYVMRERFMNQGNTNRLSKEVQRAFIIKTINAHLLGSPITLLRYSTTESPPELISVRTKA